MGCEGEAAASEQPELLRACNSTGTEETGKLAGLGGKDWSEVRSQFMSCFLFSKQRSRDPGQTLLWASDPALIFSVSSARVRDSWAMGFIILWFHMQERKRHRAALAIFSRMERGPRGAGGISPLICLLTAKFG